MPTEKEIFIAAVDGWEEDKVKYVSPYWLGKGGEGCVVAAERHMPNPQFGSPCANYVAIKLPIKLSVDPQATIQVDNSHFVRLRAEHEKRRRLGNLPHLGQLPDIHAFPRSRIRRHVHVPPAADDTIPVLITPIRLDRPGSIPVPLRDLIQPMGCWCLREFFNWRTVARALALALWSIHAAGWAHGDVKPDNVVLFDSGGTWHDVNLIDFGLLAPDIPQPMWGMVEGTPWYMRPIRFTSDDALHVAHPDHKTAHARMALSPSTEDVYALGVLLLELLLGTNLRDDLLRDVQAEAGELPGQMPSHKQHELFGKRLLDQAMRAAEDDRTPKMRRLAFQLCLGRLVRLPPPGTSGIDLLRAFLAALDTHMSASSMMEAHTGPQGALATQISSLVDLGEGVQGPTCERYVHVDASRVQQATKLHECVNLLRQGYGSSAAEALTRLIERRLGSDQPLADRGEAYDLAHAFRVLTGVLYFRESRYDDALALLTRGQSWLQRASGDPIAKDVLAWWLAHLVLRLGEHKLVERRRTERFVKHWGKRPSRCVPARSSGPPTVRVQFPEAIERSMDPRDIRERTRFRAWQVSFERDWLLHGFEETPDAIIQEMLGQRESTESSYEAAYGAMQIVRALVINAIRSPNRLDSWGLVIPTTFLAAGWALVRSLHHEYAGTLVVTAASTRSILATDDIDDACGGSASAGGSGAPAEDRPTKVDRRAEPAGGSSGQPAADPAASTALVEMLRRQGADIEACLLAAAHCAKKAAELYDQLNTPKKSMQALLLAAECYRWCRAPEHRVQALRWLTLARNNTAFKGIALAPDEMPNYDAHLKTAVQAWVKSADIAYKRTAGGDPGAFLTRAMLIRYGVGLRELLNDSLTVEVVASDVPATATSFRRLLDMAKQTRRYPISKLDDKRMLDLGCRLGRDSLEAAELGFRAVHGVDAMAWCILSANEEKTRRPHLQNRVTFALDDRRNPDAWGSDAIDVVLSRDTLTRVSDKNAVLRKVCSHMRPGGWLLMTEWYQRKHASHADWDKFCETSWLTGLETEETWRKRLERNKFEVLEWHDATEAMHAFFEACVKRVRAEMGNDPFRDPAALARALVEFDVLRKLSAEEKFLGWVFIVARWVG